MIMPTTDQETFLNIPGTVSTEAQEFLRTLKDPALSPPFPEPDDIAGWKKVQAFVESEAKAQSDAIVERYAPTVTGACSWWRPVRMYVPGDGTTTRNLSSAFTAGPIRSITQGPLLAGLLFLPTTPESPSSLSATRSRPAHTR